MPTEATNSNTLQPLKNNPHPITPAIVKDLHPSLSASPRQINTAHQAYSKHANIQYSTTPNWTPSNPDPKTPIQTQPQSAQPIPSLEKTPPSNPSSTPQKACPRTTPHPPTPLKHLEAL
ncbi:hypothetical protein H2248_010931 [Termitomyces sp. 'cryptogamus']|nr:hypothetical protein H2248_010931 [Termitomyces sp. 'cryptogamus']